MRNWGFSFILLLAACSPTQTPSATETSIPNTPTLQIVEVTRVVIVEQTVVVTATFEPLLAQECFDNAATQLDLGGCAAEERFAAQANLEQIISQLQLDPEEKEKFDQLQTEWEALIEQNCIFYYDRWGSMRSMNQSMCIASRIKERIKELEIVYLTPDG